MTIEPGSDELFAVLADVSEIGRGARRERFGQLVEEWRVRMYPVEDDPGADYPDRDETPPGDPPEFDPLPPPPR